MGNLTGFRRLDEACLGRMKGAQRPKGAAVCLPITHFISKTLKPMPVPETTSMFLTYK